MSDLSAVWHNTFANWPAQFKKKGVISPVGGGEAIPFIDYVMTDEMVVLERATPDNSGARRVAIPFSVIETLKYTEPLKTEQFLEAGYKVGGVAKERPQKIAPVQPGAPIVQPQQVAQAQVPPAQMPPQQTQPPQQMQPPQQTQPPVQAPPQAAPVAIPASNEVAPALAPRAVSDILRQSPPAYSYGDQLRYCSRISKIGRAPAIHAS